VVEQLRRLSLAGRVADEKDLPAKGLKHRTHPREDLSGARRHDRQRARLSARDTTAHRRVEVFDACSAQRGGDLLGDDRAGGGEVDERLDRVAVDDTAVATGDDPDRVRRRQADEHYGGGLRDLGGRAAPGRAARQKRRHRLAAAVMDRERVSTVEQRSRELRAHRAEPDAADLFVPAHHPPPPPRARTGGRRPPPAAPATSPSPSATDTPSRSSSSITDSTTRNASIPAGPPH